MTHIISHTCGGLGNQMFQYAAGKALAQRQGAEFLLDTRWFAQNHASATPRPFLLSLFSKAHIQIAQADVCDALKKYPRTPLAKLKRKIFRLPKQPRTYIKEPHFAYWPGIENIQGSAYLEGYWQNERYFAHRAGAVRHDFTFPELSHAPALAVAEKIQAAGNAVCVHIRRGDYISSPAAQAVHGTASPAYYETAIARLMADAPGARLFFFSDDMAWVEHIFQKYAPFSTFAAIPEHETSPWNDMHLMSLCRHHIIANSSFSWWGAWLASGHGAVYAPKRWFAEEGRAGENPCPDRWNLL